MATGERIDPYAGFNFLVEIEGITGQLSLNVVD